MRCAIEGEEMGGGRLTGECFCQEETSQDGCEWPSTINRGEGTFSPDWRQKPGLKVPF